MPTSLLELPLDEKLRLVEDLWDSIAQEQDRLPVPDSHRVELDARLRAFELDGALGDDAGAVIEGIRKRL